MHNYERNNLARLISLIGRGTQIYFDRELKPQGIRAGQLRILMALHQKDGVNQEYIRQLSHLDKATIAKAIKPLIDEGYIERKKNKLDKRTYQLSLTKKGQRSIPEVKRAIRSWTDVLTLGFSDEEIYMVNHLLGRMADNVRLQLFDEDNASMENPQQSYSVKD
jgi:DNA-binding MarR family transcriptional regulator